MMSVRVKEDIFGDKRKEYRWENKNFFKKRITQV